MIVPKLPRNLSPLNVLTICLIKACYLTDKKRKKQCMLSNRLQVEIYLWAYPYSPSPSNFTTIHKARSNSIQISNLCYAMEVLPNINNESQLWSLNHCVQNYYHFQLTQLSVLKVKLADTCENGTRSNAANAPASLLLASASDATVVGVSTCKEENVLETVPVPTNIGVSSGPWQLNRAVIDPASCNN